MSLVTELLIGNLAASAILALVAIVAGRFVKSPSVVHALWVLVLLKLLTPSLFRIPVELPQVITESLLLDTASGSSSAFPEASLGQPLKSVTGGLLSEELRPGVRQVSSGFSFLALLQQWAGFVLVAVWAGGALFLLSLGLYRGLSFHRTVRLAKKAPGELCRTAEELALRIGLNRCPELVVTDGQVPPLVWAFGRTRRVVLPEALILQMDALSQSAVIAHELAHLRRRDHWVRVLEMISTALFWWNPLVWIARSRLREAEELCCDAWVLRLSPERPEVYARTLLNTLDFLCEAKLPAAASGMGNSSSRFLERRLRMIMERTGTAKASLLAKTMIVLLALTILPLTAAMPQQEPQEQPKQQAEKEKPTPEEIEKYVKEALEKVDVEKVVAEAMAELEKALASIDIETEVAEALADVDIDAEIAEALEEMHEALQEADLEIEEALADVDIDEVTREALESARKALNKADIEKQVRRTLENIDINQIVEQAMREAKKAKKVQQEAEKPQT